MGRRALPLLMAVLSFCVRENVEVRRSGSQWRIDIFLWFLLRVELVDWMLFLLLTSTSYVQRPVSPCCRRSHVRQV